MSTKSPVKTGLRNAQITNKTDVREGALLTSNSPFLRRQHKNNGIMKHLSSLYSFKDTVSSLEFTGLVSSGKLVSKRTGGAVVVSFEALKD
jgi:hypothetical protein